jgi:hypothetical protein
MPGARSPGSLNFVLWRLILVGRQCGTCCISPFWSLEFWDGSRILENFCTPEFGPIKLKPSLCLIKQCCMTKYVGVELDFHAFITAVLVGGEL